MNAAHSLPPVGGHESYHSGGSPVGYYEKPKPAGESNARPGVPLPHKPRLPKPLGSFFYFFCGVSIPKKERKRKKTACLPKYSIRKIRSIGPFVFEPSPAYVNIFSPSSSSCSSSSSSSSSQSSTTSTTASRPPWPSVWRSHPSVTPSCGPPPIASGRSTPPPPPRWITTRTPCTRAASRVQSPTPR